MKLGLAIVSALALAVFAFGAATPALAQQAGQMGSPAQCNQFVPLNNATQMKANAVQAAMKAKADRKDICKLMTAFVASETLVVKFLVDNKTWCGIPDQAVEAAKASHEKIVEIPQCGLHRSPGPESAVAQRRHQDHAGRFRLEYQDRPRRHFRHADRQSAGTMIRR